MKKYFAILAGFFFVSTVVWAQNPTYVRKMLEPQFFIPQKDKFNQPEKLSPVVYKKPDMSQNVNEEVWEGPSEEEPPYRKEYDKYHKDLVTLDKTGKLYRNVDLDNTLAEMQGGEVFEVKSKPSQNSEVNTRFEKAIQETLQND